MSKGEKAAVFVMLALILVTVSAHAVHYFYKSPQRDAILARLVIGSI